MTPSSFKEPYTVDELKARIASHDYNAELLLLHAMELLRAQATAPQPSAPVLSEVVEFLRHQIKCSAALSHVPEMKAHIENMQRWIADLQGTAQPSAEPVLCVSSKDFGRLREADAHIKAWLPPVNGTLDMPLYAAPIAAQPAASVEPAWVDAILDDLQAQFDSEMITENDSGEALIRLDNAKAAVIENGQRFAAPVAAQVPQPDRKRLRELIDLAWKTATDSLEVPETQWADSMIDRVFGASAQAPDTPVTDKGHPRFIAGYEAGMKDAELKQAAQAPQLTADVEAAVCMLEEGEWAEHFAKSNLGKRLEYALTDLHNDLHALADCAQAPQAEADTVAPTLRAMATNYSDGHLWDKLDARACIRGAREIERLRAAQAPAVPEGLTPEVSRFLSDVMTAAGLVSHGKQCKALGERLSEGAMKFRFALSAPTPPASAPADRDAILEQAAQACERREGRVDRKFAQAACRLCAKDIRALMTVVNQSLTTEPASAQEPEWIDDPHDVEQGMMRNPKYKAPTPPASAAPAAPQQSEPSASPAALTEGQREAILEVMALARDEGLPGTAETLQSILAASPAAPAPKCTRCEYIGKCDCKVTPAPAAQAQDAARFVALLGAMLAFLNGCSMTAEQRRIQEAFEAQGESPLTLQAVRDRIDAALRDSTEETA